MISLPEAVAALDSVGARVNLVFHDVTESRGPSSSRYTISLDRFDAIVDWLGRSGLAGFCRLYFDDNYPSFHQLVVDRADLSGFHETVLAVPAVNVVAADGCGNWRDLERARELGVTIIRNRNNPTFFTMNHWNRCTPVTLPGNPPVSQSKTDGSLTNIIFFQIYGNLIESFFTIHPVKLTRVEHYPFTGICFSHRSCINLFVVGFDHRQNIQVILFSKFKVTLIMCRHGHNRTRAIFHQGKICRINRHTFAVHGIYAPGPCKNSFLFMGFYCFS